MQPYALNSQDPQKLVFGQWNASRPSGVFAFHLAYGSRDAEARHALQDANGAFLDFVAGGYSQNRSDPDLIIGASDATLYVRSAAITQGKLVNRPPQICIPVILDYDETQAGLILRPLTHGKTVNLAVSPSDSDVIALTGWETVADNSGSERIYVTKDQGLTWSDVTGNIKAASGVTGNVRPGGILIVDLLENGDRALLVGTANGILVTFLGNGAAKHLATSRQCWNSNGARLWPFLEHTATPCRCL